VVFLTKPENLIVKLIEPCEDNASLIRFVGLGGGFHHLCFKCENLDLAVGEMQQKDVMLIVPPQPGEAFENHDIAFFLAKNRLNFELIDTDEKAGKI
jgi:methylmalonyl-CoA/ethylmalonyl-CoA epimerase